MSEWRVVIIMAIVFVVAGFLVWIIGRDRDAEPDET
jgi:hypothetical protein